MELRLTSCHSDLSHFLSGIICWSGVSHFVAALQFALDMLANL
jgi:hypothetical protein